MMRTFLTCADNIFFPFVLFLHLTTIPPPHEAWCRGYRILHSPRYRRLFRIYFAGTRATLVHMRLKEAANEHLQLIRYIRSGIFNVIHNISRDGLVKRRCGAPAVRCAVRAVHAFLSVATSVTGH